MACIDACYFKALSLRELSTLTDSGKPGHVRVLKQQLTKKKPPVSLDRAIRDPTTQSRDRSHFFSRLTLYLAHTYLLRGYNGRPAC
jgi:hypothetical protein